MRLASLSVAAAAAISASPAQGETILAEFRDHASWHYTSAEGAARVTQLNDGSGELWVEIASSSSAFKFFSDPQVIAVAADAAGNVLGTADVSGILAMGSSFHSNDRHHRQKRTIESSVFAAASYAFFQLDYCAWSMGFDRTVTASNGCAGRTVGGEERRMKAFTDALRARIGTLNTAVGVEFEIEGWKGMRIR
jgi:hypothetical protein